MTLLGGGMLWQCPDTTNQSHITTRLAVWSILPWLSRLLALPRGCSGPIGQCLDLIRAESQYRVCPPKKSQRPIAEGLARNPVQWTQVAHREMRLDLRIHTPGPP